MVHTIAFFFVTAALGGIAVPGVLLTLSCRMWYPYDQRAGLQ